MILSTLIRSVLVALISVPMVRASPLPTNTLIATKTSIQKSAMPTHTKPYSLQNHISSSPDPYRKPHTSHTKFHAVHSQTSHSHFSHPTPTVHKQPTGGGKTIVSNPIPGSLWEKIRKALLLVVSILVVLAFFTGVVMYVAATWGSGEGWFGKEVPSEEEVMEKKPIAQTIGSGATDNGFPSDEKFKGENVQEMGEKGKENEGRVSTASQGDFQFRVPSLDGPALRTE